MCPLRASESKFVFADIERDDGGRRESTKELKSKMAQSPHTNNNSGGANTKIWKGVLDGMVRRQTCISEGYICEGAQHLFSLKTIGAGPTPHGP